MKKFREATLHEILQDLLFYNIDYTTLSLTKLFKRMDEKIQELESTYRPTSGAHLHAYINHKFAFIKKKLLGLEKGEYGNSKVCSKLLEAIKDIERGGQVDRSYFNFERMNKIYGIKTTNQTLGFILDELKELLGLSEETVYRTDERKQSIDSDHFQRFPVVQKHY